MKKDTEDANTMHYSLSKKKKKKPEAHTISGCASQQQ